MSKQQQKIDCNCIKKLYKIFKGNSLQNLGFQFPEYDVMLAITFIEKFSPKQINKQIEALEFVGVNLNPLYQACYHALEVYTVEDITEILNLKLEHRKHQ